MGQAGAGGRRRAAPSAGTLQARRRPLIAGWAAVLLALVLALSPSLAAPGALPASPAAPDPHRPAAPAASDNDLVAQVAELRELNLEPVPVESMTQDELRAMLMADSAEDLAEMAVTQDLFVLLDFLDEGDSLYDLWVQSYTQDTLGFYNYRQGKLCLIGDSAAATDPEGRLTLVHEYAHALQDQHFDLSALHEQEGIDSEASGARLALVEGDATLVMALYANYYLTSEELAAIGDLTTEPGAVPDVEMPPIIEQSMLFPYERGLQFVVALFREGGWEAVNEAYRDPPVSSEQILHPRKYYRQRDDPVEVTLPDMAAALGEGWTERDSEIFGEFDLMLFLQEYLDERDAASAAAGWGGDRYSFLEDEAGAHAFVLSARWDDKDEAREFYDACVERCAEKGGSGRRGDAGASRTSGEWEVGDQSCRFALDGESVYLVMAPDAGAAGRALSALYHPPSRVWVWAVAGAGLAFLIGVLGASVLLLRRRRQTKRAWDPPPVPPDSPLVPPDSPAAA